MVADGKFLVEAPTIDAYGGAAIICATYYFNQLIGGACGGYTYIN